MNPQAVSHQDNTEQVFSNIPQSIICKFSTNLSEYPIENVEVDISTEYDEQALNKYDSEDIQIVKQMIQSSMNEENSNFPIFDFLVAGKLLRGKLKSHLVRYEISCEEVIDIEYFVAFQSLEQMNESPAKDWISSLCEVVQLNGKISYLAGMYNGKISVHSKFKSKKPAVSHWSASDSPIKAMKCLQGRQQNTYFVISGGLKQDLIISEFNFDKNQGKIVSRDENNGNILAIELSPLLDGYFCTAGNSGALSICKLMETFSNQESNSKKKKKKLEASMVSFVASQIFHNDTINSLRWINSAQILTGSSDHSIKVIDVEHMREIKQILTKDSITSGIDFCGNTILTSHEDGYLRSWDLRNPTHPSSTFKSHSKYASCVQYGKSSNIFASGSYDQTVKIWDCRSIFPLQSIATNYDKVFCLSWKSQNQLVSGGSQPFITMHSV